MLKISKNFNPSENFNLVNNDAFCVFADIPTGYADHVITDPPYNISGYDNKKEIGWVKSNKYWTDDKKFTKIEENWDKFSDSDYDKFTELWLNEIFRIVKPNGNIMIFGTYHNIYKIGALLQKYDKKIINSITWFKRNAFPNITQRMLCESTEYVIWAVNNNQKKAKNWTFNYNKLKDINIIKICKKCKRNVEQRYAYCGNCGNTDFSVKKTQMRNLWDIPSTPTNERKYGKHPSQKPVEVIERLVTGMTNENDIIIDPFMGSGTVPLVAKSLNRKFIGIDNDENYCELARKRIINDHKQEKLSI
ncbi:MAG: site-specific DNA-methyltransferase [Candidatus Staskawiczbacteria bacterium]|nr:site-specific DNA-methyltransferase [Candidatus Staskawiczbacteria bacterium]